MVRLTKSSHESEGSSKPTEKLAPTARPPQLSGGSRPTIHGRDLIVLPDGLAREPLVVLADDAIKDAHDQEAFPWMPKLLCAATKGAAKRKEVGQKPQAGRQHLTWSSS